MHYIWNRADRVSPNLMPHRLIECFEEWEKEQLAKLKLIADQEILQSEGERVEKLRQKGHRLRFILRSQRSNLEEAVNAFERNSSLPKNGMLQ